MSQTFISMRSDVAPTNDSISIQNDKMHTASFLDELNKLTRLFDREALCITYVASFTGYSVTAGFNL